MTRQQQGKNKKRQVPPYFSFAPLQVPLWLPHGGDANRPGGGDSLKEIRRQS